MENDYKKSRGGVLVYGSLLFLLLILAFWAYYMIGFNAESEKGNKIEQAQNLVDEIDNQVNDLMNVKNQELNRILDSGL